MSDIKDVTYTEEEPHDRMTGIVAAGLQAMKAHPDWEEGMSCCAFADDENTEQDNRAGSGFHGYQGVDHAVYRIEQHVRALLEAHGGGLYVVNTPLNPN